MLTALALTLVLGLAPGQGAGADARPDQAHAEDVEGRLSRARQLRRAGRSDLAEQEYRRALAQAPDHLDALTGLANLLTARGAHEEAAALLDTAEGLAPDSADVLAARAQNLRRAGQSSGAEIYYDRAHTLRPEDRDVQQALEQLRRVNRHRVEAIFYTERTTAGGGDAHAADVNVDLRASDRLRVNARVQAQTRFAQQEARVGGGVEWRARADLTVRGSTLIGPGADLIARSDTTAEIEHVRGRFESAVGIRSMTFAGADVWIIAPAGTMWLNDRAAVALRYYRSATTFDTRPAVVNHSGAMRLRLNVHPRVWLDTGYSRGFESFEQLSADRLGLFRADTFSGGLLYHLPALQSLSTTVEYQRRSDGRTMVRVTAAVVHRF